MQFAMIAIYFFVIYIFFNVIYYYEHNGEDRLSFEVFDWDPEPGKACLWVFLILAFFVPGFAFFHYFVYRCGACGAVRYGAVCACASIARKQYVVCLVLSCLAFCCGNGRRACCVAASIGWVGEWVGVLFSLVPCVALLVWQHPRGVSVKSVNQYVGCVVFPLCLSCLSVCLASSSFCFALLCFALLCLLVDLT